MCDSTRITPKLRWTEGGGPASGEDELRNGVVRALLEKQVRFLEGLIMSKCSSIIECKPAPKACAITMDPCLEYQRQARNRIALSTALAEPCCQSSPAESLCNMTACEEGAVAAPWSLFLGCRVSYYECAADLVLAHAGMV